MLPKLSEPLPLDVITQDMHIIHIIHEKYKDKYCDNCVQRSDQLKKYAKCLHMYYCSKECQRMTGSITSIAAIVAETCGSGYQRPNSVRDVWVGLSSPLQSAPGYQLPNSVRDVWVGLSSPLQSAPGYQLPNSVRDVWVGLSSPLQSAPGYQLPRRARLGH
ncbi:unnamed protein product, partial [Medioppia subpectinata]